MSCWCAKTPIPLLLVILLIPTGAIAAPRVELEIVTDGRVTPAVSRAWHELLNEAGVNSIRFRSARTGEKPAVSADGPADSRTYRVVAELTGGGTLQLPGASLTSNDRAKLADWLDTLQVEGEAGVTQARTAFGLTETQLESVLKDLSQPVRFSTRNQPPLDVLQQLKPVLSNQLVIDPALQRRLASGGAVLDELEGLSAGTAVAALLRPAGAVLIPRRSSGPLLEYFVTLAQKEQESWPVGWPSPKADREVVPALFEFVTVELEGISAQRGLSALQGKLKIPMLIDYKSLAEQEIDLAKASISIPSKRTFYSKVLDQLLFQAKCKKELRTDEAGNPIFWITTLRSKR